ncbi:hypothetical protein DFH11DRAFT_458351 [Phellopilus nigrolimitatus]|nr:hypothetical protein DFH11DRAFT_458351 [Phellopilus nigrolimitatus]
MLGRRPPRRCFPAPVSVRAPCGFPASATRHQSSAPTPAPTSRRLSLLAFAVCVRPTACHVHRLTHRARSTSICTAFRSYMYSARRRISEMPSLCETVLAFSMLTDYEESLAIGAIFNRRGPKCCRRYLGAASVLMTILNDNYRLDRMRILDTVVKKDPPLVEYRL